MSAMSQVDMAATQVDTGRKGWKNTQRELLSTVLAKEASVTIWGCSIAVKSNPAEG